MTQPTKAQVQTELDQAAELIIEQGETITQLMQERDEARGFARAYREKTVARDMELRAHSDILVYASYTPSQRRFLGVIRNDIVRRHESLKQAS